MDLRKERAAWRSQFSGIRRNNACRSSQDVYIAIVSLNLLRHEHCITYILE